MYSDAQMQMINAHTTKAQATVEISGRSTHSQYVCVCTVQ